MKHLFILAPPRSGSTILWIYLSRCEVVHTMKKNEGQKYFENIGPEGYKHLFFIRKPEIFSNEKHYNWTKIKERWDNAWDKYGDCETCKGQCIYDRGYPYEAVYLEKSPPNLMRHWMLNKHFENAHFIVLTRSPYAHIESLIRFYGTKDKMKGTEHFTDDVIQFFKQQKQAMETLKNVVWIKYEDLCERPKRVRRRLVKFMPELKDINLLSKDDPLINCNDRNIKYLMPVQVDHISEKLREERKLLRYFKYKIKK